MIGELPNCHRHPPRRLVLRFPIRLDVPHPKATGDSGAACQASGRRRAMVSRPSQQASRASSIESFWQGWSGACGFGSLGSFGKGGVRAAATRYCDCSYGRTSPGKKRRAQGHAVASNCPPHPPAVGHFNSPVVVTCRRVEAARDVGAAKIRSPHSMIVYNLAGQRHRAVTSSV